MSTHGKAAAESMLRVLLQHNLTPQSILEKFMHDATQLAKRRPPHDNGTSFSELPLGTPEIISLLQALPAESDPVKIAEMCFSIGWNAHFLTHQALFDKERTEAFHEHSVRAGMSQAGMSQATEIDSMMAFYKGAIASRMPEREARKEARAKYSSIPSSTFRQAIKRWRDESVTT